MTELSTGLRCTFTWVRYNNVIALTDLDDGTIQMVPCSVANDAKNVIAYLVKVADLQSDDKVVYCDIKGRWDEITHERGRFVNLAAIGLHSLEATLTFIKNMYS